MPKRNRWRIIAIAFALVFLISSTGLAVERAEEQMVVPDLLIGRPLGGLALGLGALTYVVTLPITIPFGWSGDAKKALIDKPYWFTVERALGEDLTGFSK
jgi:hypothetical protein